MILTVLYRSEQEVTAEDDQYKEAEKEAHFNSLPEWKKLLLLQKKKD